MTATVNPNGLPTNVFFEYGANNVLDLKTPKISVAAGLDPTKVAADLLGLEPGTSYSYRVVAESLAGTTTGPTMTFSTPPATGTSAPAGSGLVVNLGTGKATGGSKVGKRSVRCTIVGTSRSDVLTGTSKKDVICGMGGNDRITGRGGGDTLLGGAGRDRITGGSGRDKLYGNAGNDRLNARDRKRGDRVSGGSGRDRASIDRGDRVLTVESVVRPRKSSKR